MKYLIILLPILLSFSMHIPHQAIYRFHADDNEVKLTVLLQSHEIDHFTPNHSRFSAVKMSRYILDNMIFKANEQTLAFEFEKSESKKDYTYLVFKAPASSMQTVDLELNTFLHVSKRFANLVELTVNGEFKSYAMNRKRTQITAKFN